MGILPVRVAYEGQEHDLSLAIVKGNGLALFGREWLAKIRLSWLSIAFHTVVGKRLDEVLQQFKEVFREELGMARTPSVHLKLKQDSQPKFVPTRSIPFAIKDAVAQEIQRLELVGILKKIEFSRWATPVVPVPKRYGSFGICGDFKVTLYPALEIDQHPIPQARGHLCEPGRG